MKYNLLFIVLTLFISCQKKETKQLPTKKRTEKPKKETPKEREVIEKASTDTIVLGDMNNDKIIDTAFVYTPPTLKTIDEKGELLYSFGCVDNKCFNKIKFSNNLPDLYFEDSVWGSVDITEDIDNDGIKEIVFCPSWFVSCWGNLYLYSLKNNKWKEIAKIECNRCGDEKLKTHIKKIKNSYYLIGVKREDDGCRVEDKVKIQFN
ncbi:MAG: hypothetical protein QM535_18095 [Limnohabitans sp.]|nr:hypothetical protein [Limnohabitans sp.]